MLTNRDHIKMAPSGWANLVSVLDAAISQICPEYEIIQVKEKFGMLRFYVDYSTIDDELSIQVSDLITLAEKESAVTCYNCGTRFADVPTESYIWKQNKSMARSSLCEKCQEL